MEFNEKLQELRRKKGLTQEELAAALYVSRTAISKWESARGYPSIESLKAIAKYFSVTIDELLSGEEALHIAEEDNKQKEKHFRDLAFGLLDISIAMLFFLPFFGRQINGAVSAVSLLNFDKIALWLKILYCSIIIGIIVWGVLILALQNCHHKIWENCKTKISLMLNVIGVVVFIVSLQPYAATFMFFYLLIKVFILMKRL